MKVFNLIQYLSTQHQCDILCFGNPAHKAVSDFAQVLPNVRVLGVFSPVSGFPKWVRMLWNLVRGLPPSLASFAAPEYGVAFRACLDRGDYDIVHYDIVNMAQYLLIGSHLPSVHSPNDATSLVYSRMAENAGWSFEKIWLLISANLLRRFERKVYPLFTKIHVVSQDDSEYLNNIGISDNVTAIPIAVNETYLNTVSVEERGKYLTEDGFRIVCTGNLGNPAILRGVLDFLEHAFPVVLESEPTARFVLLGQNIDQSLQEQLKKRLNVEFLTWVDDYRTFLASADVVLVPDIVGPSGAKTRTVQAMGLGLPVVGTETAFAGIPIEHGEHGFKYITMPECAECILKVLRDRELCESLGTKAHQLILEEFSLSVVGRKYELLYQEAIDMFERKNTAILAE